MGSKLVRPKRIFLLVFLVLFGWVLFFEFGCGGFFCFGLGFFLSVNQDMQFLSCYSVGFVRETCRLKNRVRKAKRELFIMSPEENELIARLWSP